MALSHEEYKLIQRQLGKGEQILSSGIARLHLASPDPLALRDVSPDSILFSFPGLVDNMWTDADVSGALVLVYNEASDAKIFQIYSVHQKPVEILFEYELYEEIQYDRMTNLFHAFEMEDCVAGFAFSNKTVADMFFDSVMRHRPRTPQPRQDSKGRGAWPFNFMKKRKTKEKIKLEDIGEVKNVRKFNALEQLAVDRDLDEIPLEWKQMFKDLGITKGDLRDPNTVNDIMEVLDANAAAQGNSNGGYGGQSSGSNFPGEPPVRNDLGNFQDVGNMYSANVPVPTWRQGDNRSGASPMGMPQMDPRERNLSLSQFYNNTEKVENVRRASFRRGSRSGESVRSKETKNSKRKEPPKMPPRARNTRRIISLDVPPPPEEELSPPSSPVPAPYVKQKKMLSKNFRKKKEKTRKSKGRRGKSSKKVDADEFILQTLSSANARQNSRMTNNRLTQQAKALSSRMDVAKSREVSSVSKSSQGGERIVEKIIVKHEKSEELLEMERRMKEAIERAEKATQQAKELEEQNRKLLSSKKKAEEEYRVLLAKHESELAEIKIRANELEIAQKMEQEEKARLLEAKEEVERAHADMIEQKNQTEAEKRQMKAKFEEAKQKMKEREAQVKETEEKLKEVEKKAADLAEEEKKKLEIAKEEARKAQREMMQQQEMTEAEKQIALAKLEETKKQVQLAERRVDEISNQLSEAVERAKKIPPPPPKMPLLPPVPKKKAAPKLPPLPPVLPAAPPPPTPPTETDDAQKMQPKVLANLGVLAGIKEGAKLAPVKRSLSVRFNKNKLAFGNSPQNGGTLNPRRGRMSGRRSAQALSVRLKGFKLDNNGSEANSLMKNLAAKIAQRRADLYDDNDSEWSL